MVKKNDEQLSDEELVELDQYLFQDDGGTDCLSLDEAHGLMTAVLIGEPSMSNEALLTLIWGEPDFRNPEQGERLTSLLIKMRRAIQGNLDAVEPFEPLSVEEAFEGECFDNFEGWCFGFMLGLSHLEKTWPLGDREKDVIAPIATLAVAYNDENEDIDEEDYEQCVELLPGAVSQLYRWRLSE